MTKLASALFLISLTFIATSAHSQAGWNKRGWYLKKPGANCVIRKVLPNGHDGKVIVRKVRVCR